MREVKAGTCSQIGRALAGFGLTAFSINSFEGILDKLRQTKVGTSYSLPQTLLL